MRLGSGREPQPLQLLPDAGSQGLTACGGLESMIISLYAGSMTIRDIEDHLATTIGAQISRETISKITSR
jgi:putative transposase